MRTLWKKSVSTERSMNARAVRHCGYAIVFFFFSLGMTYGQLTARIPALKEQIGASEAIIGLVVFCLGCGSLTGFALMPLLNRFLGSRSILRLSSLGLLISLPLCGLAQSPSGLSAGSAFLGFAFALADVAVNTQAVLFERRIRRHCMSRLHAFYSLGGLAGSVFGACFAALEQTPLTNFMLVSTVALAGWFLAMRHLLEDTLPKEQAARRGSVPLLIYFYGLLGVAAFAVEGSCAEWSALLLHSVKGAEESFAALGFGVFSVCIALCRLMGDRLRDRFGDYAVLLLGGLTATAGMSLVLFSPWPLLCLAGYAVTGLGVAPMWPLLLSRIGDRKDIDPQRATTVMATMGYAGLLVIPPSIGGLAGMVGLRNALLLPLGLCLFLTASARLFRHDGIRSAHD